MQHIRRNIYIAASCTGSHGAITRRREQKAPARRQQCSRTRFVGSSCFFLFDYNQSGTSLSASIDRSTNPIWVPPDKCKPSDSCPVAPTEVSALGPCDPPPADQLAQRRRIGSARWADAGHCGGHKRRSTSPSTAAAMKYGEACWPLFAPFT